MVTIEKLSSTTPPAPSEAKVNPVVTAAERAMRGRCFSLVEGTVPNTGTMKLGISITSNVNLAYKYSRGYESRNTFSSRRVYGSDGLLGVLYCSGTSDHD